MNSRTMRQAILCGTALSLIAALLTTGWANAQGAQFTQRERLESAMDNSAAVVIHALESVLSQEQITAVESVLFPPPTDAQQREALDDVKQKLLRAGFGADDPLVTAVAARADAIVVAAPPVVQE